MTFFKTTKNLVFGVLAAAIYVSSASAATLFDNGLPNTTNGFSILGSSEVRDDFTLLTDGTVVHVTFYFQNYNGITGWNQDITYNIWDALSGGNLLATGAGVNVTPVDSGLPWCCGGGNAWQVDFDLQTGFAASAGNTYWLGLTGATGTATSAWWVTTDLKNGNSSIGNTDFAFLLTDVGGVTIFDTTTAVPANNYLALALLTLLLAGFGWVGIRRT
ncbi:MAG: hypothetical protein QNK19_00645 [Xanthomonadales bacterium]|nr:hypothetical protein [Xanthomonadales bacterium]